MWLLRLYFKSETHGLERSFSFICLCMDERSLNFRLSWALRYKPHLVHAFFPWLPALGDVSLCHPPFFFLIYCIYILSFLLPQRLFMCFFSLSGRFPPLNPCLSPNMYLFLIQISAHWPFFSEVFLIFQTVWAPFLCAPTAPYFFPFRKFITVVVLILLQLCKGRDCLVLFTIMFLMLHRASVR